MSGGEASVPMLLWVGALVVQSAAAGIIGTWWVSRIVTGVNEKIHSEVKLLETKVEEANDGAHEGLDKAKRELGETVAAVRQKIHDHEIFCRDTYVRRDSFYKVTDDQAKSIVAWGDKIEKALLRMENKIESLRTGKPLPAE